MPRWYRSARERNFGLLTCRDVTERTSDYIDANTGVAERLALRVHYMLCAACRAYLAQMRATMAFLRGRGAGEPPEGLAERIAAQAEQDAAARREKDPKDGA